VNIDDSNAITAGNGRSLVADLNCVVEEMRETVPFVDLSHISAIATLMIEAAVCSET
jgi:hypothetical protein